MVLLCSDRVRDRFGTPLPRYRAADSSVPLLGDGQDEGEPRARSAAGPQREAPAVPFGDVAGDGQAQPDPAAARRPGVVEPREALEDALGVRGVDAGTV